MYYEEAKLTGMIQRKSILTTASYSDFTKGSRAFPVLRECASTPQRKSAQMGTFFKSKCVGEEDPAMQINSQEAVEILATLLNLFQAET